MKIKTRKRKAYSCSFRPVGASLLQAGFAKVYMLTRKIRHRLSGIQQICNAKNKSWEKRRKPNKERSVGISAEGKLRKSEQNSVFKCFIPEE